MHTTIRKLYRAFRFAFPLISAARAVSVARRAYDLPANVTHKFEFSDATEAERESLFRPEMRPARVYWRPTEYSPNGHSLPEACGMYNPRNDSAEWCKGYAHVRYVDRGERAGSGLRLAGFADEIAKAEGHRRMIEHTGWFTDPYGHSDGLFRGVVYLLPHGRFVYGYADPNNPGNAVLCFDNDADTLMQAANFADRFAQVCAEHERDYQTKELASMRADECREAIKALRADMSEIRAELKQARARCKRYPSSDRPKALVRAVLAQLSAMRQSVKQYRAEIEKLTDNPYSLIEP